MRILLASLFTLMICLSFGQFGNPTAVKKRLTDSLAHRALEIPEDSEIAFAIVKDTSVIFIGIQREDEKELSQYDNRTVIFEIGAITKVFTGMILAHYILEGKINPDDLIKDKTAIRMKLKATFQQLVTHYSGLDRQAYNHMDGKFKMDNPHVHYTDQIMREYLDGKVNTIAKPGQIYHYSNIGYGILTLALTKLEYKTYEELVQLHILDVYGMDGSAFTLLEDSKKNATPYSAIGNKVSHWTFSGGMAGSDGLRSSTEDMSKFIIAHFNTKDEIIKMCTTPSAPISPGLDIGYGWEITSKINGRPMLHSKGRTGGFTSSVIIDQKNKIGIVVLTNQTLEGAEDIAEMAAKMYCR